MVAYNCYIQLTNCVNLATRVRVDILRAIAKQFGSDKKEMYVCVQLKASPVHEAEQRALDCADLFRCNIEVRRQTP